MPKGKPWTILSNLSMTQIITKQYQIYPYTDWVLVKYTLKLK